MFRPQNPASSSMPVVPWSLSSWSSAPPVPVWGQAGADGHGVDTPAARGEPPQNRNGFPSPISIIQ